MLAFLALLGAPYIYEISSLTVNNIGVITIHDPGMLAVHYYTSNDGGHTIGIVMQVNCISQE